MGDLGELFPFRKDFAGGRFAYIAPLLFGRARLCLASIDAWRDTLDQW